MTAVAAHLTLPGQRHGWLAEVATLVDDIVIGRAAERMLADDDLSGATGLARLPVWCFGYAKIAMGRKDQADLQGPDGPGRLRMPLRLDWQPGPLILLTGTAPPTASWTMHSLGHHGTGAVDIYPVAPGARPPVGAYSVCASRAMAHSDGVPAPAAYVQSVSAMTVKRQLNAFVEAGTQARWALVQILEPQVKQAVIRASSMLARDLDVHSVLDAQAQGEVVDKIVYGKQGTPSSVWRLIDRLTAPLTFNGVDPSMYIRTDINRVAREAVRRQVGDPKLGTRVREVFRAHQPTSMEQFLAIYRAKYPEDRLAESRALAALSAGADVMARAVVLADYDFDQREARQR